MNQDVQHTKSSQHTQSVQGTHQHTQSIHQHTQGIHQHTQSILQHTQGIHQHTPGVPPQSQERAEPGRVRLCPPEPADQDVSQPPLEHNESVVYEEEVPVIVRRRGCTLRVRITSFSDDPFDAETVRTLLPSSTHTEARRRSTTAPNSCHLQPWSADSVSCSLRRLRRTLSEDTKRQHSRRDSLASMVPFSVHPPTFVSHRVNALVEPTILHHMRTRGLGPLSGTVS
ncbi:hypothetical protein ACOMHN_015726 [Nucella lapillus]